MVALCLPGCDIAFPFDTAMTVGLSCVCISESLIKVLTNLIMQRSTNVQLQGHTWQSFSDQLVLLPMTLPFFFFKTTKVTFPLVLKLQKKKERKYIIVHRKIITQGSKLPCMLKPCQSLNGFLNVIPKSNPCLFIFQFLLFSLLRNSTIYISCRKFCFASSQVIKSLSICLSSLRRT